MAAAAYLSCYHCKEALLKTAIQCEDCHSAFYCSQEHGQADFELHKTFCKKQPHEFSHINEIWKSNHIVSLVSSSPKNSAASTTPAVERDFYLIQYHETTKALESITAMKMNEALAYFLRHLAQRLAGLRPDQALFVTNRWGPAPVIQYDGLFIYRFVPKTDSHSPKTSKK